MFLKGGKKKRERRKKKKKKVKQVYVTEAVFGPQNLKRFIIWLFIEKVCQSLS